MTHVYIIRPLTTVNRTGDLVVTYVRCLLSIATFVGTILTLVGMTDRVCNTNPRHMAVNGNRVQQRGQSIEGVVASGRTVVG